MSVQELEHAISRLSKEELTQFGQWFDEFRADQWDRQIEEDIRAGRLDDAAQRADDETAYLLSSDTMRKRLLVAKNRGDRSRS